MLYCLSILHSFDFSKYFPTANISYDIGFPVIPKPFELIAVDFGMFIFKLFVMSHKSDVSLTGTIIINIKKNIYYDENIIFITI